MISTLLASTTHPLPDTYTPPVASPVDFQSLFLRLIVWTVLLISLCLTLWLIVRHRRHPRSASKGNLLQLQAVVPLSRGACLYFVQVEEQTVAVATDSGGLRTMILLSPAFADSLAYAPTDRAAASYSWEPTGSSPSTNVSTADALVSPETLPITSPRAPEKKAA
jgi:hypothetical protein